MGGSDSSLPDVQSLPSPSRQAWALWASCVMVVTKAPEHQGQAVLCSACLFQTLISQQDILYPQIDVWTRIASFFCRVFWSYPFCNNALFSFVWQLKLHVSSSWWEVCIVIRRKWAEWRAVVLLTQARTEQRLWTACRSLVSTLILDTHWTSGPTLLQ